MLATQEDPKTLAEDMPPPRQAIPTRYLISAKLVTTSPLAIHNGFSTHDLRAMGRFAKRYFREPVSGLSKGVEDCDALVVRDWNGLPYIPGSSLKGVMREYLTQGRSDRELGDDLKWLLGRAAEQDDAGEGGAAIFEDASLVLPEDFYQQCGDRFAHLPFWDAKQLTYVEQHTSINRRTGAVNSGSLFNTEVVPSGLTFVVNFVVDHGPHSIDGVKFLLMALAAFDLDLVHSPPQLGSETNNGWGRMNCLADSVEVKKWTPTTAAPVITDEFDSETFMEEFRKCPPHPKRRRVAVSLSLNFNSAFITLDPGKAVVIIGKKTEFFDPSSNDSDRKPPDLVPRVVNCHVNEINPEDSEPSKGIEPEECLCGTPLLPATGFRGAFRSQLELILRTVHPGIGVSPHGQLEEVTKSSPEFVKQLLGMETQKSGLWCSDFVGTQCLPLHLREMVAIDRFTSSVAGSAKYNAMVFESPTLTGELAVDLPAADTSARQILGAMILGMRDLIEGDISFGYGDMKGFGQCTAQITNLQFSHGNQWTHLGVTANHLEMCNRILQGKDTDEDRLQLDELLDQFLAAVRPQPPDT